MTEINLIDLIKQDIGQPKKTGNWNFWNCPFHNDGVPSFAVRDNRYYCFGCQVTGDAVDWLVKFRKLTIREALFIVKENAAFPVHGKPIMQKAPHSLPVIPEHDDSWNQAAIIEGEKAHDELMNLSQGQDVRDYLTRRGLMPETWKAWSLGSGYAWNAEAKRYQRVLVIPYLDNARKPFAFKYRFLVGTQRYTSRGKVSIYGLWQTIHPTLIIVEGEINALSIWQALQGEATVISPGGQGVNKSNTLALLRDSRFHQKIVWFDEPDIIREYAPFASIAVCSPENGKKWDANTMLQENLLRRFIDGNR